MPRPSTKAIEKCPDLALYYAGDEQAEEITISTKKYSFKCRKCGELFERSMSEYVKGYGLCQRCAHKQATAKRPPRRLLLEVAPDAAEYIQDDTVDIKTLGVGSAKLLFRCRECSSTFERRIDVWSKGQGLCQKCAAQHAGTANAKHQVKNRAIEICPDMENYIITDDDVQSLPANRSKKYMFHCKECGVVFERSLSEYTKGTGLCRNCIIRHNAEKTSIRAASRKSLLSWFEERGLPIPWCEKDLHDVSYGSTTKLRFRCSLGHEFKLSPYHVSCGFWCPVCGGTKRQSKGELILYYLFKDVCEIELQKPLLYSSRLSYDVFFPTKGIAFEFDGQRWHKDPEKDNEKNDLAAREGIALYRIREPKCPELSDRARIFVLDAPVSYPKDMISAVEWVETIVGEQASCTVESAWQKMLEEKYSGIKPNNLMMWLERNPDFDIFDKDRNLLSPEQISIGNNTLKVHWICKKCGSSYKKTPSNTVRHHSRCPFCNGTKINTTNLVSRSFPELKRYYSVLNVEPFEQNTQGSEVKRIWVCDKRHYFESSFSHIIGGRTWCPYCAGNLILPGYNDFRTLLPELSDYPVDKHAASLVAKCSKQSIEMQCPECGFKFQCSPLTIQKRTHPCPNWRKHDRQEHYQGKITIDNST